jgi:hypothetical protein
MRPTWLNRAGAHFAGHDLRALYQQALGLLFSGDVLTLARGEALDPALVGSFGSPGPPRASSGSAR